MFAVLVSILALATADEPQAPSSAQPQNEADRRASEREAELDRVVCRREHVVGSNRPQRICMTVREWEHQRDLSRESFQTDNLQRAEPRGPGEGAN